MTVNYFRMTIDQLHEQLKIIDASIAEASTPRLVQARKELIDFFVEHVGYNPDNLCTTSSSNNQN